MKKQEFLLKLQEELEVDSTLTEGTDFKNMDEWDSLTAMVLIGFVSNEFGISLNANDLDKMDTLSALMDHIGQEKFE